jgi:hypothetical protein
METETKYLVKGKKNIGPHQDSLSVYELMEYPELIIEISPIHLMATPTMSMDGSIMGFSTSEPSMAIVYRIIFVSTQLLNHFRSSPSHSTLQEQHFQIQYCCCRLWLVYTTTSKKSNIFP